MRLVDAHTGYWDSQPGPKEHDRFWEGLHKGWDDASMFLNHRFGPQKATSVIGFEGPWLRRRTGEHVQQRGDSQCVWEFGEHSKWRYKIRWTYKALTSAVYIEHGWKQGVSAAMDSMLA